MSDLTTFVDSEGTGGSHHIPDGAELKYSPGIREVMHLPLEFTPGPVLG